MGKAKTIGRSSSSGRFTTNVAARERTVPKSSAAYVYAGGKGEAAYKLSKIIEGSSHKRFSRRSAKTGAFLISAER